MFLVNPTEPTIFSKHNRLLLLHCPKTFQESKDLFIIIFIMQGKLHNNIPILLALNVQHIVRFYFEDLNDGNSLPWIQ